jgi:hypothetical protein
VNAKSGHEALDTATAISRYSEFRADGVAIWGGSETRIHLLEFIVSLAERNREGANIVTPNKGRPISVTASSFGSLTFAFLGIPPLHLDILVAPDGRTGE